MGNASSNYNQNPEPGDLIEISRGGYQHWAVYVGDGYVVHLTRASGFRRLFSPLNVNGLVRKEKLQDIVGRADWKVKNILDNEYRPRPVDVIVREACALEGRQMPYNIATRNCERFATELRYGKQSQQSNYNQNPEPGDLIEIFRGPFQHWAVYVGDGYVVHLTRAFGFRFLFFSLNLDGRVKKEKLQDVVGTNDWTVNNMLDNEYRPRPVDVIVREACALEGRNRRYWFATRSCELFANELRYGKKRTQLSNYNQNPEPGDLIEISRGTYQHWAVYVGDGYVVHLTRFGCSSGSLSSDPDANGLVMKEKLQDVVGTDDWTVNNILDKKYRPQSVDVIVREACALVGREMPYDIVKKNCEHFSTGLRYGRPESQQVVTAFKFTVEAFAIAKIASTERLPGAVVEAVLMSLDKYKEDKATH
ncbi:uncharacterized protein LOC115403164 isoform X3 [Salarias fasciatus]|uniref:uncharacterized protein LOC115403164 isoform X3 n=1 Tax=Salarias fasciatus TaxID=181472 RepID=UPI001176AA52|nr:uncharacterized protein LOC115403164 isoform X3 [Salarias fasciatus]